MRGIWRKRDKMRGKIARKGDKRAKGKSASGKQALSCLVVVGILMSAVSISILVAAAEVDIAQGEYNEGGENPSCSVDSSGMHHLKI